MTWKIDGPQGREVAKTRWRAMRYLRGKGLDLGCGPEKILDTKNCLGVDSTKDVTLFNIPMNPDIVTDVTDLSMFNAGAFEWVFSSHTLEHIPFDKVPETLRHWMRIIKEKGFLVLYLPDADAYPKCVDPEMGISIAEPGCNPDHKWNVTYDRVVAAMEKTGYNWDLVQFEQCHNDDEYSLFFSFMRLK
jgi:predicted SAM-dependent methyltransferase